MVRWPTASRFESCPTAGKSSSSTTRRSRYIRIDDQSRLQFGTTEVVIGIPFTLEINGIVHHLNPHRTGCARAVGGAVPVDHAVAVDLGRR